LDVVTPTPLQDLFFAELLERFRFVESLQVAVMLFVQFPGTFDRQPHQIHLIQGNPQRADRTFENRCEGAIEFDAFVFDQLTGRFRFLASLVGQIDVRPTREAVFEVPLRLTVTEKNKLRHDSDL